MEDRIDRPDPFGIVKLYHPSGALVSLPVLGNDCDPHVMLDHVSRYIEAGWLVTAPGLEEGEQKFDAVAVCVRTKQNQDGSDTLVLDLYEADAKFRSLVVYLNDEEAERAFEMASGLNLSKITPFPGQAPPEWGASKSSDAFIHRAPRPFTVVCKANPKHDPAEKDVKKMKPKRVFVRWGNLPAGGASEFLSRQQVIEVLDLCRQCGEAGRPVDMQRFLAGLQVESVERIRGVDFHKATMELERKLKGGGK